MSDRYEKLKKLLKELFQLDQPDLDFGLYRIMHAKSGEVTAFLDNELLPQVKQAFALYQPADKAAIEQELAQAIEQARSLGVDPETTQKVKDLREKRANTAVDIASLEAEVYDHLYSFFRRYYSEGDFLSKRVYKEGVYAIPYAGEEVTLHWANKDQYYIKTSEYLRDYCIRLRPDDTANAMRVHFRLTDAAEGEHGNVKAAEGKDRVFVLAAAGDSGHDFLSLDDGPQGPELCIGFEYRPATLTDWPAEVRDGKTKAPAQKDLTAFAVARVLALTADPFGPWIGELRKPHVTASGDAAEYSRLEGHLKRYTARNTFDYFIHKDLGTFLRRELDFYIKNEVMHLDDIENEKAPRVEQYLSKIRVIRRIAGKIIDFLAQLEEFQKKLWLKKKFVVETQWLVRVGCIPDEFHAEIAANDAQREEWAALCAIDEIEGDLTAPGYSVPLKPEFLQAHRTLVVDTRHFGAAFTARLLEATGCVDEQMDGVLFHSENFQALSLCQAYYRSRVRLAYLDPPYNTGQDEFAYKDSYQTASWLAMMYNRLQLLTCAMPANGVVAVQISDHEHDRLKALLELVFPAQFINHVCVRTRSPSGFKTVNLGLFESAEYLLLYGKDKSAVDAATVYVPSSYDENYKWLVTNKSSPSSDWTIDDLREVVARRAGHATARDAKRTIGEAAFLEMLSEAALRDAEAVFRPTEIDEGGASRETVEIKRQSLLATGSVFEQQRPGLPPRYVRNGQEMTFLKKKVREIDGRPVFTTMATNIWTDIAWEGIANEGGVTLKQGKKPERLVERLIDMFTVEGDVVCDFFAGSGTTCGVAIKTGRKLLGVEAAAYFDSVLLPRIKRALRGDRTGVGKSRTHVGKGLVKYVRLESYEDALNNLDIRRRDVQKSLLDEPAAKGDGKLREQYLLKYMLDVETRGSQSLLNVEAFRDPTAYRLSVKGPGSDASREVCVDLVETFNWLIGLTVEAIAAPQVFSASFERDAEKRLQLKEGRIKLDASGPFWFRRVEGRLPDGRKALVVWRKVGDDLEQANLVLDHFLTEKLKISTKDFEFDVIYVNGSNNLENLKAPDDTWKVRLLEEEFHRLMFATEDV